MKSKHRKYIPPSDFKKYNQNQSKKNNLKQNEKLNNDKIKCTECELLFDSAELMTSHFYDMHEKLKGINNINNANKDKNFIPSKLFEEIEKEKKKNDYLSKKKKRKLKNQDEQQKLDNLKKQKELKRQEKLKKKEELKRLEELKKQEELKR